MILVNMGRGFASASGGRNGALAINIHSQASSMWAAITAVAIAARFWRLAFNVYMIGSLRSEKVKSRRQRVGAQTGELLCWWLTA